jgi:5-methylcytosine-specific restriction endonuclease McrA
MLTGKRGKGGSRVWLGIKRPNGDIIQIVPFDYDFRLTETGLCLDFFNQPDWVSVSASQKFVKFHLKFSEEIHTLCYHSNICPILPWDDECQPFSTFYEHLDIMFSNDSYFFSHPSIKFPIITSDLENLIESFVCFYPVYDSYIQIAKGEKVRFRQLLKKLNQWYEKQAEIENEEKTITRHVSPQDILKAKELADQRIKVMPAMRWQVFQRDAWKCVSCGRRAAFDDVILHVDHINPRSKGGKDSIENYQTLCSICNIGKSNKDNTDLRKT